MSSALSSSLPDSERVGNSEAKGGTTTTENKIACFIGKIEQTMIGYSALVVLPPETEWFFHRDGKEEKLQYAWMEVKGHNGFRGISIPGTTQLWKYYAEVVVEVPARKREVYPINTKECTLRVVPELSGIILNKNNQTHVVIVRDLVDGRNLYLDKKGLIKSGHAISSVPSRNDVEGELYNFSIGRNAIESLKKDRDELKDGLNSAFNPRSFSQRVRAQAKNYESIGSILEEDGQVSTVNSKGTKMETKTKVAFKSVYTDVDYRKAKWTSIRARGRTFSNYLAQSPSTLLKPIKTWVKSIGDVEEFAISGLMAIYAIIALGNFTPTETSNPGETPPNPPNSV